MIRLTIILLFLAFINFQVFAQDWFSENSLHDKTEGYVIGIAGDTIHGYIQYDYPIVMQKRIGFFKESDSQSTTFKPEDIRGYSLGNRIWSSVKVAMDTYNGIYNFNRFGILESDAGPLTLIRIFEELDKKKKKLSSEEAEVITDNITKTRNGQSIEHLYIKKLEEPAELLTNKDFNRNFIEKMRHYVGDYPELMGRIESKELNLEDIDEITSEYNSWYLKKIRR